MSNIIEEIQNRYQVKEPIILTPFIPLTQPVFIEDDELCQLLRIYVLDELGGKITEVKEGETAGEALQRISQKEKNDARFIFSLESSRIAIIPHNTTEQQKMETIPKADMNYIKEECELEKLEQVPFYASMTPHIVKITEDEMDYGIFSCYEYEKIYLLDIYGNKVSQVVEGNSVFQTLEELGEDADSVAYVLSVDFEEISVNPGFAL